MSDEQPWSTNPNAPQIPYDLYFGEKANFAGILIGAILYGVVIVLFFHCMGALIDPVNRKRRGIKWGLVSYTLVMFAFVTIFTAMNLNLQSISYIDNREYPGSGDVLPPGPLGYQWFMYSNVLTIVPNLMFLLNNWMADGLLLYRCYVIYSMNIWVIAFPCVMYLGSVAMGVMFIYQTSQPNSSIWNSIAVNFGLPYFSISIALNVLLTLMIVVRLVLHSRNIRSAMGTPVGVNGLYKAIVTMLIESSALYAVNSLLFIGPWGAGSHAADIFLPILAETQVIAPFLIIQRVANQSALTSTTIASRSTASLNIGSSRGKTTNGSGTLAVGYAMDKFGKSSGDLGIGVETTVDLHQDKV